MEPNLVREKLSAHVEARLLLQSVLAVGVLYGAAAARRGAASWRPTDTQALRFSIRGTKNRWRASAHAARATPSLSRSRTRPVAQIPRHTACPATKTLSAAIAGRS